MLLIQQNNIFEKWRVTNGPFCSTEQLVSYLLAETHKLA